MVSDTKLSSKNGTLMTLMILSLLLFIANLSQRFRTSVKMGIKYSRMFKPFAYILDMVTLVTTPKKYRSFKIIFGKK